MFCPVCKSEYIEGVTECYDCHVPLVKELPHPEDQPPVEFEEVVSTYNQGDIATIRSLLDNAEIEYFISGEMFNLVDPLIQPARLYARKDQAERAKKLIATIELTFLGVSTGHQESPPTDR